MTRIITRFALFAAAATALGCAQSEDLVEATGEQSLAEIEAAQTELEDFEGTVGACIEELALCIADEADGCKEDFRACMPERPKPDNATAADDTAADNETVGPKGKKGKKAKKHAKKHRKGKKRALRGCIKEMVVCIEDGGDALTCADEAKACFQAAIEEHRAKHCAKGLERCASEDAPPAEVCEKIEAHCATDAEPAVE